MKRRDKYTNIGREKFDFDFNLQYCIFKYFYCEKLTDKTYYKIEKEYDFRTYRQWKNYIENKYDLYKKDELKEFIRFLKMQLLKSKNMDNASQIIYSAFIAVVMTILVNGLMGCKLDNIGLIILTCVLTGAFLVYIIYDVLVKFHNDKLEIKFYEDYIEIIEKILKHKK